MWPRDRRGPERHRFGRGGRRGGDQGSRRRRNRAGRGELRILRHAARGDWHRPRRLRAAARSHRPGADKPGGRDLMNDTAEREFDGLLEYLQRSRGFDFRGYKRPSLMRRVEKRMQHVKVARFSEYTDYLEVHPGE